MSLYSRLSAAILLAGTALPAAAQQLPPVAEPADSADGVPDVGGGGSGEVEGEGEGEEIVVTGTLQRGSVPGDIAPELQLNAADIRTYGAASVSELLEALAPQTRSGRGRGDDAPVVLLNGRRVSGFSEIRDIPTEAIQRVEILPEEVALKFGYRADQRVVNFVLRERFRSYTAEGNARVPTEGGTFDGSVQAGLLRIDGAGRFNLDLQYQKQGDLLESSRDIITSAPSLPYDVSGNVGPASGASEIDPALSALAGTTVTVAGVPTGARTLADFAGTAGMTNVTDLGRYRTLRPATERFSANATLNRTIFGDVSATGNLRVETTGSDSLLGLPTVSLELPAGGAYSPFSTPVQVYRYLDGTPLQRSADTTNVHGGLSLNGDLSDGWRWSATANYDRNETTTETERGIDDSAIQAGVTAGTIDPFGPLDVAGPIGRTVDRAKSISSVGTVDALLSGSPISLPAGSVQTALRFAGTTNDFTTRSLRSGVAQSGDLSRDSGSVRANIDLPIANASRDVLSALGRLSLNGNAEVERLSDFGSLYTLGYGINWTPISAVRLIASVTHEDGAPSQSQLGNPVVITPNARVYDAVRGETVEVTQIDGGNSALTGDERRVLKIGLNVKPLSGTELTFNADYTNSRIRNAVSSFPAVTAAIEAAFPERFTRDADGQLLRIDNRPVNFARNDREQIRWGINFSKSITTERQRQMEAARAAGTFGRGRPGGEGGSAGAPERPAPGAPPAADGASAPAPSGTATPGAQPPAAPGGRPGGGFGGRGGGGGRFGGGAGGRLQLALYHTLHLRESILIREGVPVLDLLDGAATGGQGGQPRHEIEAQAGLTRDGIGARVDARWQSATRIADADAATTSEDLRFSGLTTVNLRLFANLGQRPEIVRKHPFLRGSRVTLSVENVFNDRIDVTDALGVVPLSYQPGYLDALGRSVRLGFRKLF